MLNGITITLMAAKIFVDEPNISTTTEALRSFFKKFDMHDFATPIDIDNQTFGKTCDIVVFSAGFPQSNLAMNVSKNGIAKIKKFLRFYANVLSNLEGDDDFEIFFEKQDLNSKFFIAQNFQLIHQLFCSSRIGNYSNIKKGLARIEQFHKNIIVSVEEPYILFKEITSTAI